MLRAVEKGSIDGRYEQIEREVRVQLWTTLGATGKPGRANQRQTTDMRQTHSRRQTKIRLHADDKHETGR